MSPAPSFGKPIEGRRPKRALLIAAGVLLTLGGIALFHPASKWVLGNLLLFGFPAFFAVMVLRECVRIGVGLAFGFELFGVQWGVGRSRIQFRIGQVHHRIAPVPIGADARFASSRPPYHRLARWAFTVAPMLFQALIALLAAQRADLSISTLSDAWSPLLVVHLANIALLGLHALVPFETSTGQCSDLKIMIVLALSRTDEHRASRATACAMQIERRLESARVELAHRELATAIMQFGRLPMLIQLEDRLARIAAAPDPRSAAAEDSVSDPFDQPWSVWDRAITPPSLAGRIALRALGVAPVAMLALLFIGFEFDALLSSVHGRWTAEALTIATRNDDAQCREQITLLDTRLERAASLFSIPRALQIHELRARAALAACARDFERAARDQALAVQIADTRRSASPTELGPGSNGRLEAELILSSELRQLAAWHAARGAFRDALRATARAAEGLQAADLAVTNWPPSSERTRALDLFARERQILETTRARIMRDMGVRS